LLSPGGRPCTSANSVSISLCTPRRPRCRALAGWPRRRGEVAAGSAPRGGRRAYPGAARRLAGGWLQPRRGMRAWSRERFPRPWDREETNEMDPLRVRDLMTEGVFAVGVNDDLETIR